MHEPICNVGRLPGGFNIQFFWLGRFDSSSEVGSTKLERQPKCQKDTEQCDGLHCSESKSGIIIDKRL